MRRGRVVIAKVGLDGHTTGAAVVARGLRDAGFEVVDLGTRVRPEDAAAAALHEDADVIGLSILSGAHLHLTQEVIRYVREWGTDAAVVIGGTIPEGDAEQLRAFGTAAVFGPGSSMDDIVSAMDELVTARHIRKSQEERNHE